MAKYLALQIIEGKLTYEKVMSKFLKDKEEIDAFLREKGREDLIPKEETIGLQK